MGRDYRLIKDGKFSGEPVFYMNVSSYMFIGRVCDLLGLPAGGKPDMPSAPHEVTGETRQRFADYMADHRSDDLIAAVQLANEELQSDNPMTLEDVRWVLEFFKLAADNPEGLASDYCEQYFAVTAE